MSALPNLAGIATDNLVEKIGGGKFSASYINWSRTMHLLRTHAPGWLPVLVQNVEGGILHRAPVGCYLLIKFKHLDGSETPAMPQAIMDTHNKAIALEKVTARDITDTHRRGICMAAAMTFGLAYELWAKLPLESGYAEPEKDAPLTGKVTPLDGVWEGFNEEARAWLEGVAQQTRELFSSDGGDAAADHLASQNLDTDEKAAVWSLLDSKVRSGIKKAMTNKKEAA
ncbi:MAG TPA: hypothetical protein VIN36_07780 [Thiobacillus sp.]